MAVPDFHSPEGRSAWIKSQLQKAGTSCSILARQEGVSKQAVSHALRHPSSHLEGAIARALGVDERELFPERFDTDGKRPRQQPRNRTWGQLV